MNDKYKYSKFLESLFRIQDFIPSRARRKYFDRVCTLLIQQDKAVFAREKKHVSASWRKEKNKKTKTFCRFSYGYRGFYIDKSFTEPVPFVKITKGQKKRFDRFMKKEGCREFNKFTANSMATFCRHRIHKLIRLGTDGKNEEALELESRLNLQMAKIDDL
ncbi:hypothetical protein RhiirA4_456560 [Rhizophagus irregularis]|uniref:Uncharacterized protein n=1 Tax=Rhizophagus irregularis TaxID=588596 RepID=A0A2I1G7Z5_9GLOM|nr:hypothetical protein RhiirA4_456560 [Rhizophagus irregularis]